MAVDRETAARAIGDFLRALGHDPDSDPELAQTPERVTAAFADELLSGYAVNVHELLSAGSMRVETEAQHGIVVVEGIAIACVCPHHLLPSVGSATVAYLPGDRLLGLGAIAGLVDALARRLALQERIAQDVVRALIDDAGARGAYCRTTLVHGCLSARGARQTGASVHAVATAGELAKPEAQAELALALGAERPPK